MTRVTHKTKCYVFVCAGCHLLADSDRSDTLTCSPKCRVKAHRNGWLKTLRGIAAISHVHPSMILQAKAIRALRPDLQPQILAGTLTIEDAQPEIADAFWKLLKNHLESQA